jgi:group I intron endonuclease
LDILTETLYNSEGQGSFPFRNAYPISDYFTIKSDLDKELEMEQDEEKKIWGFVYVFNINGKKYVGQTVDLKQRLLRHLKEKNNSHFHNSLRKYWKFGCFKIIESHYETKKNLKFLLDEREMFWIAELDTYDPKQKKGWNLTKGGSGQLGYKHKEETKMKIKNHQPDRSGIKNPMFGRTRENSPSWGKKRLDTSNLMKQRIGKLNPLFGTKWKPHQYERMSGKNHPNARSVLLISPEGEEYKMKSYYSFCKNNNLDNRLICCVLKGKRNHHKGWTGHYVE